LPLPRIILVYVIPSICDQVTGHILCVRASYPHIYSLNQHKDKCKSCKAPETVKHQRPLIHLSVYMMMLSSLAYINVAMH